MACGLSPVTFTVGVAVAVWVVVDDSKAFSQDTTGSGKARSSW